MKSFGDSVPNELIRIAVKVKDAIYNWFEKEVSALAHCEKSCSTRLDTPWKGRGG